MKKEKQQFDYWLFLVVITLVCIGLVMVLSSSQYTAAFDYDDSFYYLKRQLFNVSVGFVGMIFASFVPYKKYERYALPIFGVGIGLGVLVLVSSLGASAGGSERWLDLGFVSFQPSDVMKIATVIFLSWFLTSYKTEYNEFFKDYVPLMLIAAIACGLIAINDLGTAIVLAMTIFFLFVVAGVPGKYLFCTILAGVAAVVGLCIQKPYRIARLTSFLDPWADYYGDGYQVIQSLLAIGSGGLFGVGLGSSGAKWFYLPERHTDFIFSIYIEETGFIGGIVLFLLFMFLTYRGLQIAIKVEDKFAALLATGITLMITLQALVNMAIALGMMPVTGITLPFISYGGTSLVICLTSVGILLNISKYVKK